MRKIYRIYKGLTGVRKDINLSAPTLGFKQEKFIIALLRHECQRVFLDKLKNE